MFRVRMLATKSIVLLLLIVFFLNPILVRSGELCRSEYLVLYGNGVNTDLENWIASLAALRKMVRDSHNEVPVSYGLAENPSDGVFLDIYQVYQQKLSEDPSLSWEILIRVFVGVVDGLSFGVISKVRALIANTAATNTAQLQARYRSQYNYVDSDVLKQKGLVLNAIKGRGNRVLLVAHSQGNLYANAVYRAVYNEPGVTQGSFSLVAVATPANFVPPKVPYTTSDNDAVINVLRQFVSSSVLPANISIPFRFEDVSGHFFVDTYLNAGYSARSKIASDIFSSMDRLVVPEDNYDYLVRVDTRKNWIELEGDPWVAGTLNACMAVHRAAPRSVALRFCQAAEDDSWTIVDRSKRRLDPFVPDDEVAARAASDEIVKRLVPYVQGLADPSSAISVFVRGRGPSFAMNVISDYRNLKSSICAPNNYSRDGSAIFPLDDPFSRISPSPEDYSPSPVVPRVALNNLFLLPVERALKSVPAGVISVERPKDQIVMKVCRESSAGRT